MPRTTEHDILPEIKNRWSPRSFTGEEIPDEKLMAIFEAAGLAPSAYNSQPWRFIYAKRGTPEWEKLFSLMVEFNQSWTKNASALVVIASKKTFDHNGEPSVTYQFDAGAAWQNIALEAQHQGYHAHGMSGFDFAAAAEKLNIGEDYTVLAMAAIGKKDAPEKLPEGLREKEVLSDRKPVSDIVFKGSM